MNPDEIYLGYPVNELWLYNRAVEQQIARFPDDATLAKHTPRTHWRVLQHYQFASMCEAGKQIIAESGIRLLRMLPIWVGNEKSLMCWVLPDSFYCTERSPKDTELLEGFKAVIGVTEEPQWYGSTEGPIPRTVRKYYDYPPEYAGMSIENIPGWKINGDDSEEEEDDSTSGASGSDEGSDEDSEEEEDSESEGSEVDGSDTEVSEVEAIHGKERTLRSL